MLCWLGCRGRSRWCRRRGRGCGRWLRRRNPESIERSCSKRTRRMHRRGRGVYIAHNPIHSVPRPAHAWHRLRSQRRSRPRPRQLTRLWPCLEPPCAGVPRVVVRTLGRHVRLLLKMDRLPLIHHPSVRIDLVAHGRGGGRHWPLLRGVRHGHATRSLRYPHGLRHWDRARLLSLPLGSITIRLHRVA